MAKIKTIKPLSPTNLSPVSSMNPQVPSAMTPRIPTSTPVVTPTMAPIVTSTGNLDNDVVNLAKAIRQHESGNRAVLPGEGSAVGGASRYQYTHGTWKSVAGKYLGDPNAPLTLENENKATYLRIKEWKDKGYNPAQIASMWNAGEGRPDAYKQNWRGINKWGVKYDTPAYVNKVYATYQKMKGENPTPQMSAEALPQQQDPYTVRMPDGREVKYGSVVAAQKVRQQLGLEQPQEQIQEPEKKPEGVGGFLKELAKDIVRPVAELGVTGVNLASQIGTTAGEFAKKATTGQDLMTGYTNVLEKTRNVPLLGETKTAFTGKETPMQALGKQVGYGLELGSYLPFGQAVGTVAKAGTTALKTGSKTAITQGLKAGALEGSLGGLMGGVGRGLQEEKGVAEIAGYGALGALSGLVLGSAIGAGAPAIGRVFSSIVLPKSSKIANKITSIIDTGVSKGIKPTGKSPKIMETYNKKAQDGILAIFDNKNNLNLIDEVGEKIDIPKNLDQFKDAITQTKSAVFDKYDNLLSTAGDAGAKIDLNQLSSKLDDVIKSKPIQIAQPRAINEALRWKEIVDNIQSLNLKEVNDTIKVLNQELKAFYRNPQYDQVSIAGVKEGVASNLRKLLDEKVNSFTGGDFQLLKNIYGSLRMLEDDVAKRAAVVARQGAKGFWDLPSAFARGDIVSGLLTLNPAAVARGTALEVFSRYFKYLNDPNTVIQKMFKQLDNLYTPKLYKNPTKLKPAGLLPQYSMKSPSKGALAIIPGHGRTMPMPERQPVGLTSKSQGQVKSVSDARLGIMPKSSPNMGQAVKAKPMKPEPKIKPTPKVIVKPPQQMAGAALGIQPDIQKDEKGNLTFKGIKFDPKMAAIGMVGGVALTKAYKNPKIASEIASDVMDKTAGGRDIINDEKVRSSLVKYLEKFDGGKDAIEKIKQLSKEYLFRSVDGYDVANKNKNWLSKLPQKLKDNYEIATKTTKESLPTSATKTDLYTQLTTEATNNATRFVSKDKVLAKANSLVDSAVGGDKESIKTLKTIWDDYMTPKTKSSFFGSKVDDSARKNFLEGLGDKRYLVENLVKNKTNPIYGSIAGFEVERDKNGKAKGINFDPKKAALGFLAVGALKNKAQLISKLKSNKSIATKIDDLIVAGTNMKNKIIRPNADPHYKLTVDPDTICPKRVIFGNTTKQVEVNIGRKLKLDEIYDLRNMIKENGVEVPCPQCYVEAARARGFNAKALNEQGVYNNEIKKYSTVKVEDLNTHAGLRYFSSTDFKPQFIDDLVRVVQDSQEKGLKSHAYTKQFDFVKIFGDTGIETNISLGGDVKGGKLVENLDIGVDWKKSFELRNKHKDVGTVYIAKTKKEVLLALDHPEIDHIIPFHASGQSKKAMESWGAVDNFTSQQNEKWLNPSRHTGDKIPLIEDSMHNGNKAKYLKLVKDLGLTPKFSEFVDHPNYMKLIGREAGKFNVSKQPFVDASKINFKEAENVYKKWVQSGMEDSAIDRIAVKKATEAFGGSSVIKKQALVGLMPKTEKPAINILSGEELIKKHDLNNWVDEPVEEIIKLGDLTLAKDSIEKSTRSIKIGNPSKTKGAIDVFYDTQGKKFIVTDGNHRVSQMILDGADESTPVKIKLTSGYSDYYATPRENNIFKLKKSQSIKSLTDKDGQLFERASGLSLEDQTIEAKAFEKIKKDEDKILLDYQKRNGNIINADSFRRHFVQEGYAGHNAAAVQEPASYLAKRAYTNALKSDGKYAVFYAGGSGTGKTSAVKDIKSVQELIDNSSVILDGNLSSYDSAVKKIGQAKAVGKKTPIVYVYRDPIESFVEGVVKRMKTNKEEMGRLVPTKVVAGNHIDSLDVVKRLLESGQTNKIFAIDNSLGYKKAKLVDFNDLVKKIEYPSKEELTNIFNKEIKKLYDAGKITSKEYQGYIK